MAIMASGIARGRVRTTTTTESRNMAAYSSQLADRDMYRRILAEECRLFLAGFLKKKKTVQQMIAEADL